MGLKENPPPEAVVLVNKVGGDGQGVGRQDLRARLLPRKRERDRDSSYTPTTISRAVTPRVRHRFVRVIHLHSRAKALRSRPRRSGRGLAACAGGLCSFHAHPSPHHLSTLCSVLMRECLLESVTEKPLHVVHIEAEMTFEIDLTDHRPAHGFDRDRRIEMASMPHEQSSPEHFVSQHQLMEIHGVSRSCSCACGSTSTSLLYRAGIICAKLNQM